MNLVVQVKNGRLREHPVRHAVRMFVDYYMVVSAFWFADRLPWFARKRVLNWLIGEETFVDFMQSDVRGPFEVCIKW